MKSPLILSAAILAAGAAAMPLAVQAESFAAACSAENLNVGVQLAQKKFFRESFNQDIVKSINELRDSAEADMKAGNVESCGFKATAVNAMVKNPARARVTLADFQSRQASITGAPVTKTLSVKDGRRISQQQLIGMNLKSVNGEKLGTITGAIYSETGQPLYLIAAPSRQMEATTATSSLTVPVGILLVGSNPRDMYVSLSSREFWKDPRFQNAPGVEPSAGN